MGTKFSNPQTELSRKIDKAYEMAGLARQDGDEKDEKRWLDEVKRLRGEEVPMSDDRIRDIIAGEDK